VLVDYIIMCYNNLIPRPPSSAGQQQGRLMALGT